MNDELRADEIAISGVEPQEIQDTEPTAPPKAEIEVVSAPAYKAPPPSVAPSPRAKERMGFKSVAALVIIGALIGGFSLGAGIGVVSTITRLIISDVYEESTEPQQVEPPVAVPAFSSHEHPSVPPGSIPGTSSSGDLPTSFSDVIKMVKPSVVSISAVMSGNQQFFSIPQTPKGSGIIFKEDDEKVYIITNNHVVSGALSVSVSIRGSEYVEAGLVGKDTQSDLSVLYVLKEDLDNVGIHFVNVAAFGNSDSMQEGDIVLAIGNAMGEGNSTTQGIISVMNKDIRVEGRNLTVIQTDAAINPGNSGGALVNMRGEVIGVNTAKTMHSSAIWSDSGTAEGMGYSIASNIVLPIANEIMLMKPKAFLGIEGRDIPKETAELYSIPELGVMIEVVQPGFAAENAGLQRHDIITAFKGQPIFTMKELIDAVAACSVSEEVEIKILRDGRTQMTVKATLSAREDSSF